MLLASDPGNPPKRQGGKLLQGGSRHTKDLPIYRTSMWNAASKRHHWPTGLMRCKGSGPEPSYRQPWAGLLSCDIIPHHCCGGLLHTCRTYNHHSHHASATKRNSCLCTLQEVTMSRLAHSLSPHSCGDPFTFSMKDCLASNYVSI